MSKKFSDKTIAIKIAFIIRGILSNPHVITSIDQTDLASQRIVNDCFLQLMEIDPILRDNFTEAEISKSFKTQLNVLLNRFIASGNSIIGTKEEAEIANTVKAWRVSLASQHELRTYYTVIDGVDIDRKVSIGSVKVAPLTSAIPGILVSRFASKVKKSPNFNYQRKKEVIELFRQRTLEFFKTREPIKSVVFSTIVDTWDEKIGQAEAYSRFEEIMNFIRYIGYVFNSRPGRIGVSLRGEFGYEGKTILGMSDKLLYTQHFTVHHYPISLSKDILAKARDIIGVFKVPFRARNEFEHQMVSAINWIGKGCVESSSGDQLVSFCIALEVLLKGDTKFGYTNIVSERISFLLPEVVIQQFKYQGVACDRYSLYLLVREIFEYRGQVVHEGNEQLTSQLEKPIRAMALILFHVLKTVRILYQRNRWTEMSSLFELLIKRKFGMSPLPIKKS